MQPRPDTSSGYRSALRVLDLPGTFATVRPRRVGRDTYLEQIARKDTERHVAAAFVMAEDAAPANIVVYYTLSAFAVDLAGLPEAMQKKLLLYSRLPPQPCWDGWREMSVSLGQDRYL